MPFGCFVTIFGNKDGLCHISQLAHERLEEADMRKMFKEGDEMEVKVLEVDDRGKVRLSRKVLLPRSPKEG
jgi:polyribonucleotide nucleotidyltransferase